MRRRDRRSDGVAQVRRHSGQVHLVAQPFGKGGGRPLAVVPSAIEAVNLGVAGYLTKPFRVPQVLAAAAKALGE